MDVLLPDAARDVLRAERDVLRDLHALLERLDTEPERLAQLSELIAHLEELFLVVVVGEFNAGKSSVLNALFGEKVVEEGPIPTTAKITILRYGPERLVRQLSEFVLEQQYPADLLKHLSLVDTPGTNSIVRRHQEITEDFIPRADLILFVTSFDRPLSESERQFLSFAREGWGKRLVFVLNKIDLADASSRELAQVLTYLKTSTQELMGFEPHVFPVSAEQAFEAKMAGDGAPARALWERSRFAPLEAFLNETLAGPEQMALKLSAPLDAAARLVQALNTRLGARRTVLEEDEQRLASLRAHFEEVERELREGYRRYLAEIDNLLLMMEQRGVQFLDDHIRISKLKLLRDRDAFKEEFSRQVIRQSERDVEDRITEAVDWLLQRVLRLWNWTLGRFSKERGMPATGVRPGQDAFEYNRAEVFEKVRRQAERRIAVYDLNEEARRILENARSAAALFLGTEGLAAGIGAVAALVVATTAVDVTGGLLAAGAIAAFGFIFLPRQKRRAIQEFKARIAALRTELEQVLSAQFDREIDDALQKVHALIAPFAGLVEREQQTLAEASTERDRLSAEIDRLRSRVRDEYGPARIGA